jgi:RNA polymerase sigma-70 factor (ECF subfamily)
MVDAPVVQQLKEARGGDATAFGALIGPLVRPAYQLAVSMLQDAIEAEDVVQDSCLVAWRKLGQLRAEASLRPWFLAIVASRCRRARRSRWFNVIKLAEPVTSTRLVPDPAAIAATELRHACKRLGHDELLVLTLYYCLDLPLDEVGTTLGISREAAKSRLYRAIRRLRPLLEDPGEVDG